jgi:hypothetical protein
MMNKIKYFIIILSILLIGCFQDPGDDDIDAPEVSIVYSSSDDLEINQGDTVSFWVDATDPQEEDLTYHWTASGGTIITPANKDSMSWRSPNSGGTYTIRVEVSNSTKTTTRSINIEVLSEEIPYVKIISPLANATLTQFYNENIEVECGHDNGIHEVRFFINDSLYEALAGVTTGGTNLYVYSWYIDVPAGTAEIRVEAESANPAAPRVGIDGITVNIGGIVKIKD